MFMEGHLPWEYTHSWLLIIGEVVPVLSKNG
jgi:hypothetical protein